MMLTNRVSHAGGSSRLLKQLSVKTQQPRHQQLLSYSIQQSNYSSTLLISQGFHFKHNTRPLQIYVHRTHQRKILSRSINVPPSYCTKFASIIFHERISCCMQRSFSSSATEVSSIVMANNSTSQIITDSSIVAASVSISSTCTASAEAEERSSEIGPQSNRRKRKRRKLSSTQNNLFSMASITPVTANSKYKIMRVMKRRRRRQKQASTATDKASKRQRPQLRYMDPQSSWNINLRKIQIFVQQQQQKQPNKSSLPIRHMIPKDKSLRRWLVYLRGEYQKMVQGRQNKLTETRLEILRSCGVSFLIAPMLVSWDERYNQLLQFLKKYDGKYPHELKSALNSDELDLYHWCNRQRILRKAYIAKKLSKTMHINDERIARLDEINFLWSVNTLNWQERYDELKEYYKAYGNCMVPARWVGNRPLARWVETQRRQHSLMKQNKPSQLTPERIKLLDELEFEWDPYEVRWLERYNELIEFQRLNGDFVLPTFKTGRALCRWIVQQQKAYHQWMAGKSTTMNEQRRDRLILRGVDWVIPRKKKKDLLSKVHQQLKDRTQK